jgi:ActR/RegA family two-component response regulator
VFGGTIDMQGDVSLKGQRVLVVEDDYYLASDLAAALAGAGAEVMGPFPGEALAIEAIRHHAPTVAIVDVDLGRGPSFDAALALKQAGVKFVFLAGYDQAAIPADFADTPRIQKPVELQKVIRLVAKLAGDAEQ